MDIKKEIERYKSTCIFEPSENEIRRYIGNLKSRDIKKEMAGGEWNINNYKENKRNIGGDGILELVGYNLSSVWAGMSHQNAEFYPMSLKLPIKNQDNGKMSLRYSRTNLQEIERIIKTYMRDGDYFLENCCGWSTFGSMACYFGYSGIGVDIWDTALEYSKKQIDYIADIPGIGNLELKKMDGMDLKYNDNKFGYIYCNPPFMSSEIYSGLDNDIADKDKEKFILKIDKLMFENYRVLKNDCLCTITINDQRKDTFLIPLQLEIINSGYRAGFKLWDFVTAASFTGRNMIMRKDHYAKKRTAKQHEYVITFKKV